MTARIDSPRALARKSIEPGKRPVRYDKKRGAEAVRQRGTDTSNLSAAEMAEVISPDKPLTEMQRAFVQFWAEGDSIQSASRRAGYNDGASVAYRMTKMPNVLKLKAELSAKYEEASQMTRKRVMDGLLEAVDMAKLMAEPASMIAGWREVGKMCGYYAPVEHRVKVDVSGNVVLERLNSMSDAELLKIITAGTATPLLEDVSGESDPD